MLLEVINESASLVIALCTGIYAYRYMDKFTRFLFYQLITWFMFYTFTHVVTHYQVIHHITQNNHWIFNIHMLSETLLLVLAARFYFNDRFRKALCSILYAFFLIVWGSEEYFCGLKQFFNFGFAAEALAVTVLYLLILYDSFISSPVSWKT